MLVSGDALSDPTRRVASDCGEAPCLLEKIRSVPADHGIRVDDRNPRVLATLVYQRPRGKPSLDGGWHVGVLRAAQRLIDYDELDPALRAPPFPSRLAV